MVRCVEKGIGSWRSREGGEVVGVIVVGGVVEVVRMAWFVERPVWLLRWEDGGSEAVV